MIYILPRIEYSINSSKSPEEINTIMKSVTVPKDMMFCDSGDAEFVGEVNPSDFKIVRKAVGWIHIRNSFIPVIEGNVKTERGISVIDIKMHLLLPVQIIFTVWFGGVGISCLCGLFAVFTKGMDGVLLLLFSVAFFALGQAFVRIGFYLPAKKSVRRLEELLK